MACGLTAGLDGDAGVTPEGAHDRLAGMSRAQKNELLFQRGVNFDRLPSWQKRGVVVAWRNVEVEGRDPRTDTVVKAMRRRLAVDDELPFGDAYADYVAARLGS